MSEYQYVAFRAVDRPLNDKQLAFAEEQSSRAEVTRWSFNVEYHYSEFGGDVDALLRGGYDVFLQYTNYGVREVRIRLPSGLPFEKSVWSKYVDGEHMKWTKDKRGRGGILSVFPYHDPASVDEVWDFDDYLDSATKLREQLILGDLRPLYLLWMCAAWDDYIEPAETTEPPVPYGLGDLAGDVEEEGGGVEEMLPFFGLDPLMLEAAGQGIPSVAKQASQSTVSANWIESLDHERSKQLLLRLLSEDAVAVKAELLAEIRDEQGTTDWPTTTRGRLLEELINDCEQLRADANEKAQKEQAAKEKREAAKAERERQARMKEMVKSPEKWLRETGKLAAAGGTTNYKEAAEILADLREAIGGDDGDSIALKQAAHLAKKHPTLNMLKSSLRKRGLLQ